MLRTLGMNQEAAALAKGIKECGYKRPCSCCINTIAARLQERDAALARESKLREALKGMLLSMDAGWELDRAGHDWPEACEAARAALLDSSRDHEEGK